MFKYLKKKINDYRYKRKLAKLPIWFREKLTLDREIVLGDKPILAYDFSKQIERNKNNDLQ